MINDMLPNRETNQLWFAQCDFIYICTVYTEVGSLLSFEKTSSLLIFLESPLSDVVTDIPMANASAVRLLILSVGYFFIFWLILFHAVLLICYLVLGFYISKRQSSKSQWQVCFSCWWLGSLGHWSARINQVMNQNVHFIFPYKPWTWALHGE